MQDMPRLLPTDLEEQHQKWLEDQFTIWVDAEARPWRKTKAGGYERLPSLSGLILRRVSNARRKLGVWGAYGDKPFIIARKDNYGHYQMSEHPSRPFGAYEILERPVKRKTWYP